MNEVPRPPGLRPGGAAGTKNVGLENPLDKVSALQSQLHLRLYQVEVIVKIAAERAAGRRRILLVAPTGAGKTLIAAAIIANAEACGEPGLFLVHRRELVIQSHQKLHAAGIDAGVILAGGPSMRLHRPVQIACIPSLHARAIRTSKIDLPDADVVIVDEAQHARARTWQQLLDRYPNALILGMTATPCRSDGRGLGNIFESMVECPQVAELIEQGYLVGAKVFAPTPPDLAGVAVRRGDYVEAELEARMNTQRLVGDVVEHWHKHAESRRTVVFAVGVKHSIHLRDEFRRADVLAEHIDGSTPIDERKEILKKLAAGDIDVVCNCMVLTEGFDCPEIGCIVLARPTKSTGLYRQMVGRGLRAAPAVGKTDCIILDHAGAVFEHGLPEDPIEWPLHKDQRAENKTHAARGTHAAPKLVECLECQTVRFQGKPCPVCGWHPVEKPRYVEFTDGELAQVMPGGFSRPPEGSEDDRRRFYGELRSIEKARLYRDGWAAHQYRKRFGTFPPWAWKRDPQWSPSAATLAYVRSRYIAFAKSQPPKPRS